MVPDELVTAVFRYVVLAAGVSVAVLFGVALWIEVPLVPLTMALVALGLLGLVLVIGPTETGVETVESGAAAGFVTSNPGGLAPTAGSIPGRYVLGFYLVGLGGHALLWIGAIDAVA